MWKKCTVDGRKKEEEEARERLPHVVSRARRTPHFGRMIDVVKIKKK